MYSGYAYVTAQFYLCAHMTFQPFIIDRDQPDRSRVSDVGGNHTSCLAFSQTIIER